jgi:spermidine/putrescine transport system substrate-binding protein
MAALDPRLLVDRGFDNLDKFLDKTLFQQPVAPDLKQRMIAEFEKIKAGY